MDTSTLPGNSKPGLGHFRIPHILGCKASLSTQRSHCSCTQLLFPQPFVPGVCEMSSVSVSVLSPLWKHPCVHPFVVIHLGCNFPKKLHWREAAGVLCWVCCSLCSPGELLPLSGTKAELLPNPVTLGHNTSPLVLQGTERKILIFHHIYAN